MLPPAENKSPTARPWLGPALVCLGLVLAVWTVFGQTLRHDFVNYDDPDYVSENPIVARGISWDGIVWAFTHRHSDNWHPLTTLSHMLDCELYGLNPVGHHLTNVLLHAATTVLLFLVVRSLTGALWRAASVATLFAVHPLRVESVAWVAERKDVLCGWFFMLTLWVYHRYVRARKQADKPTAIAFLAEPFYWLALAFFAAGLMSKPMLVTLPFVLLLLDYWPLNRLHGCGAAGPGWRWLILEKIPFLLLTVTACGVTIWAQSNVLRSVQPLPLLWRVGNAAETCIGYLGQMICPVGLAVFYPHPQTQLSVIGAGLCGLALVSITGGVVALRRRFPYLLVGWLWYLGMLVPVIGLMQVGDQAHADRYTYLPQIGLGWLAVWGAADWARARQLREVWLGAAAAVIGIGLLAGAFLQTRHWKNSLTLWTRALECVPDNAMVRCSLGLALAGQGKGDEAIAHYNRALQLKPNFAAAHVNWGIALAAQGQWDAALDHYDRALQLNPDLPDAAFNYGNALARQKKWRAAIPYYERALQLKPDLADAHVNLGSVLVAEKQYAPALQHFAAAARLQPESVLAQYNWGHALAVQGDRGGAIHHLQQALNLALARNDAGLATTIRARLKSCQTNSPAL